MAIGFQALQQVLNSTVTLCLGCGIAREVLSGLQAREGQSVVALLAFRCCKAASHLKIQAVRAWALNPKTLNPKALNPKPSHSVPDHIGPRQPQQRHSKPQALNPSLRRFKGAYEVLGLRGLEFRDRV